MNTHTFTLRETTGKRWGLFCLGAILFSWAIAAHGSVEEPVALTNYLELYRQHPNAFGQLGSSEAGEIEVVLEPEKIAQIEQKMFQKWVAKGISPERAKAWSRVGIIAEDAYRLWVRDAVIFPTQATGTYIRILSATLKTPGAAILPILPDGRIALLLQFRHPTRSWEIEIPRGGANDGETSEETARRELHEETGYHPKEMVRLGDVAVDSGVLGTVLAVYAAAVVEKQKNELDDEEAIEDVFLFTKEEIKQALLKGHLDLTVKGRSIKAYCRDPFFTYALVQAETKGLL